MFKNTVCKNTNTPWLIYLSCVVSVHQKVLFSFQFALRVKALKRQVDESETELERLDGLRRKAQRDMEEQMETKEALQSRIAALEAELK